MSFGSSILRNLKTECTKEPGNLVFWDEVKKNNIGLITASEAARHGGKSNVPDSSAEKVRRLLEEARSLLTLSSSGQPNLVAVRKIDTQCYCPVMNNAQHPPKSSSYPCV